MPTMSLVHGPLPLVTGDFKNIGFHIELVLACPSPKLNTVNLLYLHG